MIMEGGGEGEGESRSSGVQFPVVKGQRPAIYADHSKSQRVFDNT